MYSLHDNDTIFLSDLRVRAIIGINDWERRVRQTVSVDLLMPADARAAAGTDDISATVNYKAVAKRLIKFIGESEFQLIETLSQRIADIVLGEFGLAWVRVSVHKPGAVRGSKDVGITITRGTVPGSDKSVPEVFVGLGSNVEPEKNLHTALAALTERFGPLRRSTVYRNAAVGFDGDDFLNMVVSFECAEDVPSIVAALGRIEQACGRERTEERFTSRTMDLDLLMCGQQVVAGPEIELPRPEMLHQAYILRPMAELAGNVVHPREKRCFAALWRDRDGSDPTLTPVDIDAS